MSEFEAIKFFLFGVLCGGVIVHIFWAIRFRDTLKQMADFLGYVRQGYTLEAAWRLAKVTI